MFIEWRRGVRDTLHIERRRLRDLAFEDAALRAVTLPESCDNGQAGQRRRRAVVVHTSATKTQFLADNISGIIIVLCAIWLVVRHGLCWIYT